MAVCETYPFLCFTDPVSSLTHLVGTAVFAVLGGVLLRRAWRVVARAEMALLGVYAFSCVFLLSMSGVYHLLPHGSDGRPVLERLDHAAIFVLIAGTYTAAHGMLFTGLARWLPLCFAWVAVAAGITLKTIFFSDIAEWVGLSFYLGLGWLGIFSTAVIWQRYGTKYVLPLIWGALAYTVGAVMEYFSWPNLLPGIVGPHELFHVLVLIGAALHWQFVYRIVKRKGIDHDVLDIEARVADQRR